MNSSSSPTLSNRLRNSEQDELGEGSRLRGHDHSGSSRSRNRNLSESNPTGSGQSHIHQSDGQGRTPTEETTIITVVRSTINAFFNWSHPRRNCSPEVPRFRASPFCPCFSPPISDSESENEDNSPDDVNWNVSENLRNRLAIVGEAANQLPLTRPAYQHVHKIVEYSHHLVPDVDKIYAASYYWGIMDRYKAEELLEGKPEGTFLLRDSAQTEYLFSVSFRRYQRTLHARIEHGNHRFGFDILDSSAFSADSVTDLISNYKDPMRCMFFEPQLSISLPRPTVFSLQELCCVTVASRTTFSRVSELLIPSALKASIRHYHYSVPVKTVLNPLE